MVHRNINDIDLPLFLWRKLSKTNKINDNVAFDTETINGRCFLISDSTELFINDNELDKCGILDGGACVLFYNKSTKEEIKRYELGKGCGFSFDFKNYDNDKLADENDVSEYDWI